MCELKVVVHHMERPGTDIVACRNKESEMHEVHLGLYQQTHYVALELPISTLNNCTNCTTTSSDDDMLDQDERLLQNFILDNDQNVDRHSNVPSDDDMLDQDERLLQNFISENDQNVDRHSNVPSDDDMLDQDERLQQSFISKNGQNVETNQCTSTTSVENLNLSAIDPTGDDQSDEEMAILDDKAFEETSQVRGLPFETSVVTDNQDLTGKQINVAPAENEKPLPLLSDKHFEELSNPDKYPDGKNALTADRPLDIHPRKYFNQRLLDCDGRFAKSIEYLLSAQYATESKQIHSDINHFVYRRAASKEYQGRRLTAGLLANVQNLNDMIKSDSAYRVMKNIRGTPGYFQTLFYDVLAMVRQLGIPTWFFTVSAADMQWPDVIQTIARQYGTNLTDDDVTNLSFDERCQWLRSNPVTAARQFQYRLELLFKEVLKSNAHPLGEIVDYVIRIEFQARGSPHAHSILWIKNAPKINVQTDQEVCEFIDKHVTTVMPNDDEVLCDTVTKLQTHSHSSYCRKKGTCRFHFPHPPSSQTTIAREPENEETKLGIQTQAKAVLAKVYDTMTNDDTPKDISLSNLCRKTGTNEQEYMAALGVSQTGCNVILERSPSENYVNAYNPTVLKAWQANMDIQYIIDAFACVMYVAAYMTKDEKGMGELLKQACKENQDDVGSVFLNNRELSAQEATYRILSMPLKKLSRTVVFINTDTKQDRVAVLKTKDHLNDKADDDEDVFQTSLLDRYVARPHILKNMCLAEFAAKYNTRYSKTDDDQNNDHVPDILDEENSESEQNETLPKKIVLSNKRGTMHKRKHDAVIRFRKLNKEKDQTTTTVPNSCCTFHGMTRDQISLKTMKALKITGWQFFKQSWKMKPNTLKMLMKLKMPFK